MRELISMIMVLALMITLSSSVFAGTSTTSCVSKASELSAKSSSAYGNTNCSAWRGGVVMTPHQKHYIIRFILNVQK